VKRAGTECEKADRLRRLVIEVAIRLPRTLAQASGDSPFPRAPCRRPVIHEQLIVWSYPPLSVGWGGRDAWWAGGSGDAWWVGADAAMLG
jgi:hypothetical protein